jgi:hypothetical protein
MNSDKFKVFVLMFFIWFIDLSFCQTVTFEDTTNYIIYDKVLHQVVKVRVKDEYNDPIPFINVFFSCNDEEIADFIFRNSFTDMNGLAVSVIKFQFDEDSLYSPPPGFRDRFPKIIAIAGGVTSEEVTVRILWGYIVEPIFMGPYFYSYFDSFIETTILKDSFISLTGQFIEVFHSPPPLYLFDFGIYSIDSRIAIPDSVIVGTNTIDVKIHGVTTDSTHIIVDGIPPAVISVKVADTNVNYPSNNNQLTSNLYQNYPNPFNAITKIDYDLSFSADVMIFIYDLRGTEVKRYDLGRLSAGSCSVQWNGRNEKGNPVASGMYFYKIISKANAETYIDVKKMIFMK